MAQVHLLSEVFGQCSSRKDLCLLPLVEVVLVLAVAVAVAVVGIVVPS